MPPRVPEFKHQALHLRRRADRNVADEMRIARPSRRDDHVELCVRAPVLGLEGRQPHLGKLPSELEGLRPATELTLARQLPDPLR